MSRGTPEGEARFIFGPEKVGTGLGIIRCRARSFFPVEDYILEFEQSLTAELRRGEGVVFFPGGYAHRFDWEHYDVQRDVSRMLGLFDFLAVVRPEDGSMEVELNPLAFPGVGLENDPEEPFLFSESTGRRHAKLHTGDLMTVTDYELVWGKNRVDTNLTKSLWLTHSLDSIRC